MYPSTKAVSCRQVQNSIHFNVWPLPVEMALCFLLVLYLFHSASAQSKASYCPIDQGLVNFCRIDAKLTLRLPIHAKKIFVARIENFDMVEPIALQEHELDQRHVVPKLDSGLHNTPGCKVEPDDTNFVRFVDINDRNIRNQDWYVACAEYDALDVSYKRGPEGESNEGEHSVGDDQTHGVDEKRRLTDVLSFGDRSEGNINPVGQKCTRCALIKELSQKDAPQTKFLRSSWVKDRLESSILRYISGDLPFESINIFGRVIDLEARRQVFQFRQLIKSKQQLFISLPRLEGCGRFAIITDLYPLRNGTELIVSDLGLALQVQDYIRLESVHENVPAAGSGGKNRNWGDRWPTVDPSTPSHE